MSVNDRWKTALALIGVCCLLGADLARAQELKLTIGNPVAAAGSPIVKKGKTAFVVRVEGCSDPNALTTGIAEGIVSGARRTDKLTLALVQPGVYAVERSWQETAIGTWIVNVMTACQNRTAAALVPIVEGGFVRETTKFFNRPATATEVEAALKEHAARK